MQAAVEPRDIGKITECCQGKSNDTLCKLMYPFSMLLAVALGLTNFVRVLGGALGIAVASATLNSILHKDLPLIIPSVFINDILEYPESLRTILPSEYIQPVIEIYVKALHIVWYVLTVMSAACKLQRLLSHCGDAATDLISFCMLLGCQVPSV